MSRILPILFNTDMVRAIQDGRKTVTRRLIKNPPHPDMPDNHNYCRMKFFHKDYLRTLHYMDVIEQSPFKQIRYFESFASFDKGDILYVRETWSWEPCWDCGMDTEEHNCCDESAHKIYNHGKGEYGCYVYKASFEDNVYPSVDVWHPSIHMPKDAARIWLKVTDVRVERLQDITEEQAYCEGVIRAHNTFFHCDYWYYKKGQDYLKGNVWRESARQCFLWGIWNGTLKKADYEKYCHSANPWVWVIEFERCEKPEPCILAGGEPAEDKRPCIGYGKSRDDDEPCSMCKGCKVCSGNEEE